MDVKISVVGAGYWGKNLIRNFSELGYLYCICDSDQHAKELYEIKYPNVKFTYDYEEVLSDVDVDGVVLATPAVTHFGMAKMALEAGKHVFVEKPLALKIYEGEELVSLGEKTGKVLMVGHILQYHNAVIKLKEMIDQGDLGKIQYIYSSRLNIGKIRTEENILWSFAPHDISVILMLLEEMPESLYATGGNYLQERISDVTMTTMDFPSGVKAHIFVSWLHPFKEQKLVVIGDKKMAVFDDTTEEKLFIYPHKIKWLGRKPVASKGEAQVISVHMTEPLKAECQHFIDCIKIGRRPRTDGHEGLRVLQVLNASQKSIDQKGQLIFLSRSKAPSVPSTLRFEKSENFYVHESAYVDEGVKIGKGTCIWHFSHILRGSKIGRDCRIGQNVVIGPNVNIGNNCKIQNNVSVYEGVTLEDHVFCGPSMVFTNVFNPRSEIPRMKELESTYVGRGATLGANCTIVCGHKIGKYAFVAAGAVVTMDVPDFALIKGNPGRIDGWICRCGVKLQFKGEEAICKQCEARYRMGDRGVVLND